MRPPASSGPSFRLAGPDDVVELVEVIQAAYRGEPGPRGWTTEAHLLGGQRTDAAMLAEALAAPDTALIVVEAPEPDGGIAGCCELARRTDGSASFGTFAVRPDQQGSGVGRALIAEAERLARSWWGSATVRMTVIRQRADILAWYERMGYVRTGETEPFPYGDERFGRPRRDDLEFVVLVKPLPEPDDG